MRTMVFTREGLSQSERLLKRDRNHRSIILWSLANEEPDQGSQVGAPDRLIHEADRKKVSIQRGPSLLR